MKNKILIIIPAYNEEKIILDVYNELNNNYNNFDVMIINDGSIDSTQYLLEKNRIPNIKLISNLGIGGAVQTGYIYAFENNYDIAVQFDGDGQHNPKYIQKIIDPIIKKQADFVIGSRFIEDLSSFRSSATRRIGIKIISFLLKITNKIKITDPTSGFRACNKKIIELFAKEYPREYPEPESIVKLIKSNYVVKEVSVEMNERKTGKSSIRKLKSLYYMINVCISIILSSLKKGEKYDE